MPRNIHDNVPKETKHQQLLAALGELKKEGFTDCGLVDLARTIDLPWVRVNGVPASGALGPYIRDLVAMGMVVRIPQGKGRGRRGRYRLVDPA